MNYMIFLLLVIIYLACIALPGYKPKEKFLGVQIGQKNFDNPAIKDIKRHYLMIGSLAFYACVLMNFFINYNWLSLVVFSILIVILFIIDRNKLIKMQPKLKHK